MQCVIQIIGVESNKIHSQFFPMNLPYHGNCQKKNVFNQFQRDCKNQCNSLDALESSVIKIISSQKKLIVSLELCLLNMVLHYKQYTFHPIWKLIMKFVPHPVQVLKYILKCNHFNRLYLSQVACILDMIFSS